MGLSVVAFVGLLTGFRGGHQNLKVCFFDPPRDLAKEHSNFGGSLMGHGHAGIHLTSGLAHT